MKKLLLPVISLLFLSACSGDDNTPQGNNQTMYFPPNNAATWETITPASLNWNESAISPLLAFLEEKHSKSL